MITPVHNDSITSVNHEQGVNLIKSKQVTAFILGITGSGLGIIGNLFIVSPTASILFWISLLTYTLGIIGAFLVLFIPKAGGVLMIFAAAVGVFSMPSHDLSIAPLLIFIAGIVVVMKGKGFRYKK